MNAAALPDAFPPAQPLTGEGAPAVLVAALAAMGVTLAVVAASMWLAPPPVMAVAPEPVTIIVHEMAPAPPPQIVEVLVPAPAPPPTIVEVKVPAAPPPCFNPLTIMFATDKFEPLPGTDADRAALRADIARLSDWLGKHAEAKALVQGHADSLGGEAHNLVLSFARAKAVSTLLASKGIPAGRMNVRAAGAGEAAAKIDRRDRRVDVSIDGVSACKSATGATEQP